MSTRATSLSDRCLLGQNILKSEDWEVVEDGAGHLLGLAGRTRVVRQELLELTVAQRLVGFALLPGGGLGAGFGGEVVLALLAGDVFDGFVVAGREGDSLAVLFVVFLRGDLEDGEGIGKNYV